MDACEEMLPRPQTEIPHGVSHDPFADRRNP
jgi:hypothetical protein